MLKDVPKDVVKDVSNGEYDDPEVSVPSEEEAKEGLISTVDS